MKIAYVIPDIHVKGGIQQFASSISKSLNKELQIDSFDYEYVPFIKISNILHKLPNKLGAFLFLNIFKYYFQYKLNLSSYDLLHFWHIDAATAYTDKKYILTCHGLEILRDNIHNYKIELYQKVLDNALYITADSAYTKELLLQNFSVDEKKIVIINPPVDTNKFKRKHIRNSKLVIGSLSRFVERKNFLKIVKALEYLHEKYKLNFIFHLAGTGPDKPQILEALEKVKFEWKYFGEISEKEKINKFYPSLDIFVMPTLDLPNSIEGFGIVYIEANSAGVPVIASPVGGVTDAVKNGYSGLYCDPKDYKDIAKKINELASKSKEIKRNLPLWIERFDIIKIANKFNRIYKN